MPMTYIFFLCKTNDTFEKWIVKNVTNWKKRQEYSQESKQYSFTYHTNVEPSSCIESLTES